MDLFKLVAKLTLDSSEYEKGLGDAETKGSTFGSGLKKAAAVGAAAVGSATTAVVAFAKKSVDTGKAFDSSMSQVAATMGMTMSEMSTVTGETDTAFGHFSGTLRDFAQYMGANTAFSASQAADALNYMALAGYDAQTSMDMLPNVLNLAAAGSIDLASASDMVTDAQSALGLSLDETSTMVDQMAKASSKSNTSVAQLGEAFLTIGATARNLAGGTTELSTVLGVLADNGIKGAEGGTHLRNMLLALQTPTKDGTAALKQLGMTYDDMYDSAGNMRSLPDIMVQLQHGMEGMTQASKDAIISGIFNKTDLAAANALIGTSKERFDELTAAIKDSKGAAQEMADTQLDNLEGDVVKFQSALEGAQIKISDQLTPSLREFVQFGTEGISKIADGFQNGGLSGAMDAFGQVLSQGLAMITEKLPQFMDAGMKLLEALGQGIMQNIPMLTQTATQIILMLAQFIITNLPQLLTAAIQIIVTLVQGITQALPELIPAAVEAILTIVQTLVDNFPMIIDVALQLIIAFTEGIINSLPELIARVPEIIIAIVDTLVENFPKIVEAAFNLIVVFATALIDNIPEIVNAILKIREEINAKFQEIVSQALSWGADLINNFVSGIKKGFGKIKSAMSGLANVVRSHIHFSEPDVGPLSDFHTYAPDMMKQFAKGIDENLPLVEDSMNRMGNMVRGNMQFSTEGVNRGATYNGGITINVYGAEGQNVRELAREIEKIFTLQDNQRRAAYA